MAHDPMNPGRPRYVGPRRENYMTWLLGALAAIAFLGIMFWAFTGDPTTTASNPRDTNTGEVTRSEPAPANPAPGGAPSRP